MAKQRNREQIIEEFRVETIQDAAIRVIARRGLGASMQEIADEAGVAKGTIYLYFKDRDDLLDRICQTRIGKLQKSFDKCLAESGSLRDRLTAIVSAPIEFFDENHEVFRLFHAAIASENPERVREHRNRPEYASYLQKLTNFFERAAEADEVVAIDPPRMAIVVAESINAVIHRRLAEETPRPASEDVEFIVSLVLNGISNKKR